ncbi:hypothetical protein ONR57_01580 [Hoyosella sp. YIM 151337]|uniref:hypothetical protein n=1 Tax=Hoyosella sp. YIM 151337 TaxID=2992742 RepID=UPI0022355296|nr:hypothetical protein [Hoyosella sp. YIM 151337]MCW4351990.1 hypothetical protein [Hoyosella sp. YIM 151337]
MKMRMAIGIRGISAGLLAATVTAAMLAVLVVGFRLEDSFPVWAWTIFTAPAFIIAYHSEVRRAKKQQNSNQLGPRR